MKNNHPTGFTSLAPWKWNRDRLLNVFCLWLQAYLLSGIVLDSILRATRQAWWLRFAFRVIYFPVAFLCDAYRWLIHSL